MTITQTGNKRPGLVFESFIIKRQIELLTVRGWPGLLITLMSPQGWDRTHGGRIVQRRELLAVLVLGGQVKLGDSGGHRAIVHQALLVIVLRMKRDCQDCINICFAYNSSMK